MKIKLLPSSFDENGCPSQRQHLACFVIDDCIALDAGSLAFSTNAVQKKEIRNVLLSHAHLDHIAGLPLFIDDLFATIKRPIQIHASPEVIEVLERDIFNWSVYPRFSELQNKNGKVMCYRPFYTGKEFAIKHLRIKPVCVNHKVPTVGFIISDNTSKIAFSSDTSQMKEFWEIVNSEKSLSALFIECAFPNELQDLANASFHLTPNLLLQELNKFEHQNCQIYIINIKPRYYETVCQELSELKLENLAIFQSGIDYFI